MISSVALMNDQVGGLIERTTLPVADAPTMPDVPATMAESSVHSFAVGNYNSSYMYRITATHGTIEYTSGPTYKYTAPDVTDAGAGAPYTDVITMTPMLGWMQGASIAVDIEYSYVPMSADDAYTDNCDTLIGVKYNNGMEIT